MKKYNFYNNLNNLFFKNTVFNKKIKNNRSSFSNVKYVFSIGDIHGDYQTFKNTILEIGKNKFISNGQNNIFNIYTKNIFGVEFELCTINEYNITNDNFIILQLGDLFYSAYKYDLTNNEEIKLIFFIFSLFDEFNRINKINKNCKYIQLLGNHDILLLASSKENIVFRHIDYIFNHNDMIENREIDNIDDFILYDYHNKKPFEYNKAYQISNFIKNSLNNIGLIFCKINNVLYTHCFFNSISLNYLYSLVLMNKKYITWIKQCMYYNRYNLLLYFYNVIFKNLIKNYYYPMELNVNDVHIEILKNFKYIANDLMHNKGNKFSIMNDLNFYFNCKKIIIGHVINTNNLNNETCYFNGLIKSLDIGISKKSIDKFKIIRDFDLFFCCQVFNFIYYTKKITFKEYFYTIKK